MTPDDILDEALHILERDGWHQGALVHSPYTETAKTEDDWAYEHWQAMRNAPVCAIGALNRAHSGVANGVVRVENLEDLDPLREACEAAFYRLKRAAGLEWNDDIPEWNDDENTTREDVILAFKRARYGKQ